MAFHDLLDAARHPVRGILRSTNSVVGPLLRRGIGSPLPIGPGIVLLETTGRASGRRREVPLLALRGLGRVVVATGRRRSDWLANLEDDPDVAVWLGGTRRPATAHVRRGVVGLVELDVGSRASARSARVVAPHVSA